MTVQSSPHRTSVLIKDGYKDRPRQRGCRRVGARISDMSTIAAGDCTTRALGEGVLRIQAGRTASS
jgi:hypothetical protein